MERLKASALKAVGLSLSSSDEKITDARYDEGVKYLDECIRLTKEVKMECQTLFKTHVRGVLTSALKRHGLGIALYISHPVCVSFMFFFMFSYPHTTTRPTTASPLPLLACLYWQFFAAFRACDLLFLTINQPKLLNRPVKKPSPYTQHTKNSVVIHSTLISIVRSTPNY